jgi:hypothetical protein
MQRGIYLASNPGMGRDDEFNFEVSGNVHLGMPSGERDLSLR